MRFALCASRSIILRVELLTMTKPSMSGRRIGLFGGTFNPIHLGHLRAPKRFERPSTPGSDLYSSCATSHKMTEEIIQADHRLEMVKRATRKNSQFSASDVELKRQGKSYSIDTIRYFREKFEDSLYFILEEMLRGN